MPGLYKKHTATQPVMPEMRLEPLNVTPNAKGARVYPLYRLQARILLGVKTKLTHSQKQYNLLTILILIIICQVLVQRQSYNI